MALNFTEVKHIPPWEKFAENPEESGVKLEGRGEIPEATIKFVAKAYHEWLDKMNPEVGTCIVCERKFKPRKTEDDSQTSIPEAPEEKE